MSEPISTKGGAAVKPVADETRDLSVSQAFGLPFFSFHYSSREYSLRDGKTQIKARECHYNGSKLTHEEFTGTADADHYSQAVGTALAQMQATQRQMLNFWQSCLPWFKPLRSSVDRESNED